MLVIVIRDYFVVVMGGMYVQSITAMRTATYRLLC